MAKSYSQIVDDVETLVQDAGIDPGGSANQVFATAEIDALMPGGLLAISQAFPWEYKLTKTTTADSRDITLSAGDKWRLVKILKLEYLVDKDPRKFRNFSRFADVVSIKIDTVPSSAVNIYFFLHKIHLLQSALGASSSAGAIKTQAAVGATSLVLKSLGTGTINEMTTIAIAGDSTVYYATAQATITTNEATVSIWPPLVAVAAADAVVTLSITGSTMDAKAEYYLAWWLAAKATISKSTKSYAQVQTAITTITNAATAISEVAALIALATTATTGDIAKGRASGVLGAAAIALALTEIDKMKVASTGPVALAITALSSGNSLVNTIPVGGGASEYMGQASSQIGIAQGYMLNGQAYLQKASADEANAAQYYNAAAADFRAASEKANEAVANLRLVATRLQVSQGGVRYEEWGRRELAHITRELLALGGMPGSTYYPRD